MERVLRFGVDVLLADPPPQLKRGQIGLVTNDAATTSAIGSPYRSLVPTRWALQRAGVPLTVLFSPEHGLGAAAADGAQVGHTQDRLTGLPVYSLYGETLRPTPEMLSQIDLLLFDIPDVGSRFYTYIWTLSHVMEACAEAGTPLWVLDRPNPLSGDLSLVEGPMLDEAHISTFVGRWSMPIRHSLTLGELARLWRRERRLSLELNIVEMNGWERTWIWPQTGNPFVPPSPNMPDYETAALYPGTCFFEGTNLSEGRGTAVPFRVVGAPWLDNLTVAEGFNRLNLPGLAARPVQFTPGSGKHAGRLCFGVMLHLIDPVAARPVAAGLFLLSLVIARHPDEFAWLPYPTHGNGPGYGHFDRLVGRLDIREQLAQEPSSEQILEWTSAPGWRERVQPSLIY